MAGYSLLLFVIQALPIITAVIPLFILFARFGLTDNLMIEGGIAASGGAFIAEAAASDAIWQDLAGFERCVAAVATLRPRKVTDHPIDPDL